MTPGAMALVRNTRTPNGNKDERNICMRIHSRTESFLRVLEFDYTISPCVEQVFSAYNGVQCRDSISQLVLLLDTSHTAQFACLHL